jgi:pimeloyl-ACP methyl ester carboxylesterase
LESRRILGGASLPTTPVRVRARVTLQRGHEFKQAEVCEIHRDGLSIRTPNPWSVGSQVDVTVYLMDETVPLMGTGEVDRVDQFGLHVAGILPTMSVRFVEFGRKAEGLRDWLDRNLYVRRTVTRNLLDVFNYGRWEMKGDRFERDFGEPGAGFHGPVLLIHGFLGTRAAMLPLEQRLKFRGFPVFSVHLGTLNIGDIRRSARRIAESVARLVEKHQLPKIDVIGHSMGGLIGLYYIKYLEGHEYVRKFISIGTPFRGTDVAYLGIATLGAVSRSAWQLRKGSRFLQELNAGELPDGPRYYAILAKND